jgi:hypothetical protein
LVPQKNDQVEGVGGRDGETGVVGGGGLDSESESGGGGADVGGWTGVEIMTVPKRGKFQCVKQFEVSEGDDFECLYASSSDRFVCVCVSECVCVWRYD